MFPIETETSSVSAASEAVAQTASRIQVEGELSIYRAHELKQMFIAAVHSAPALEVDLARVTEVDSAGVQLLMLLQNMARECGCALRFSGHSAAVKEVFGLLNLGTYFADPLLAPASFA
jgi:anti-sigma B factor antagonist